MDSLKWFSELLLHTTARAHSHMKTATSKRSNPENQRKEVKEPFPLCRGQVTPGRRNKRHLLCFNSYSV